MESVRFFLLSKYLRLIWLKSSISVFCYRWVSISMQLLYIAIDCYIFVCWPYTCIRYLGQVILYNHALYADVRHCYFVAQLCLFSADLGRLAFLEDIHGFAFSFLLLWKDILWVILDNWGKTINLLSNFESLKYQPYIVFPFIDSLFAEFLKMIACPNELILYAKGVLIQGQILCVKVEFIQGMIVYVKMGFIQGQSSFHI